MSSIIQLLPDHVANQIAAGEVVQRPASVVKELLENAVDAKATDIKLIIKDAGKSLVQVIDNGVPIPDRRQGLPGICGQVGEGAVHHPDRLDPQVARHRQHGRR